MTEIADKHRTLSSSISALKLPKDISVLLNDANHARNAVAHDLAKGLTGSLDIKLDEVSFTQEVSELIFDLAYGDVIISSTISMLNGETLPRAEFLSEYVEQVMRWVVEK
ncbi:hypothetical protein [Nitrosomonas eutropha]|uniref:hypothetical protein n=1 Tax=Nitrosomonas eutropha TaxID=916 RepID=UPI0008B9A3C9|nr:hypothetical protein [Nitrosomonas eutropha]SEJ35698.1 hypothetical protein SAMN05216318_1612 [Nitrosomonas eutropha]